MFLTLHQSKYFVSRIRASDCLERLPISDQPRQLLHCKQVSLAVDGPQNEGHEYRIVLRMAKFDRALKRYETHAELSHAIPGLCVEERDPGRHDHEWTMLGREIHDGAYVSTLHCADQEQELPRFQNDASPVCSWYKHLDCLMRQKIA